MKITKDFKIVMRYVIMAVLIGFTFKLSLLAYNLEVVGKLTFQFAGVVASAWGVVTLVIKTVYSTQVSE